MLQHATPVRISGRTITTPRLKLRPWDVDDADQALRIFGSDEVARWLMPAMSQVPDLAAMRGHLERWAIDETTERPTGRWAVEEFATGRVVGGAAVLPLPPLGEDLEIGLAPEAWGRGLASEAGHALAQSGSGWSGSARPRSTTTSGCRCFGCARESST